MFPLGFRVWWDKEFQFKTSWCQTPQGLLIGWVSMIEYLFECLLMDWIKSPEVLNTFLRKLSHTTCKNCLWLLGLDVSDSIVQILVVNIYIVDLKGFCQTCDIRNPTKTGVSPVLHTRRIGVFFLKDVEIHARLLSHPSSIGHLEILAKWDTNIRANGTY